MRYPKSVVLVLIVLTVASALGTVLFFNRNEPSTIIVNKCEGGRLGDQILSYSKAKWLSYKYSIPFRLIPFTGYEQLHVSNEPCYTTVTNFFNQAFYLFFGRTIKVTTEKEIVESLTTFKGPTRFVVHLSTRFCEHIKSNTGTDKQDHAWLPSTLYEFMRKHPDFGQALKDKLQPITPIPLMHLPSDKITVAVHIRKGGGFDPQILSEQYFDKEFQITTYEQQTENNSEKNICTCSYDAKSKSPYADSVWPDKFPPEQYYVTQLQNLSKYLHDIPLYVYIFTDDKDPVALTQRIEKNTNKPNITFACRTEKNSHGTNVLYDVYAMANFDCLIRSGSHFAYISQMIGNHKIILYPLHMRWVTSNILWVDRVGVIIRNQKQQAKKFGGDTNL